MSSVFASVYAFIFDKNKEVQDEIFKENEINEEADEFHNTFILTLKSNMKLADYEDVFADVKNIA